LLGSSKAHLNAASPVVEMDHGAAFDIPRFKGTFALFVHQVKHCRIARRQKYHKRIGALADSNESILKVVAKAGEFTGHWRKTAGEGNG
jgi:hypothetical protein